ncbi:MAG: DUF4038 domain-containing protein [Candidatus Eisenbacteria bacterium]
MRRPLWLRQSLLALGYLMLLSGSSGAVLQVSSNQRYLEDEFGNPFFLTGDAAWSLIAELTLPEATIYLDDREAKGFNLAMVNLIEHQFSSNPPANAYGDVPFTGRPFVTPNEDYFAHADAVVALAEERGIVLLLAPVYLGYGCGNEGWCGEVQAATLTEMREWGRFLGARYAGYDNIVWLIGGDTDPTPVADKLTEVVNGSGVRLHPPPHGAQRSQTQAIDAWPGANWIGVNSVYTYSNILYEAVREGYEVDPPMPLFLLESAYENEHGTTPESLRRQSYWAALSGAFGHVFGNCPIWHFGYSTSWCGLDDWEGELGEPGSVNMSFYRKLFESRRWTELVPDFGHDAFISGFGAPSTTNYATAAVAADGSSIVAFLPTSRTVTIDAAALTGDSTRGWWYDPEDGAVTDLGTLPRGTHAYAPPGSGDWVLVVDDASLGFPPPGQPLVPAGLPPVDGNGSASRTAGLHVEPNPSRGEFRIEWTASARPDAVVSSGEVAILDAGGRRIRSWTFSSNGGRDADLRWDGRDDHGVEVPAGSYLVRVVSEGQAYGERLVLVR